jgi:hypothetical protein
MVVEFMALVNQAEKQARKHSPKSKAGKHGPQKKRRGNNDANRFDKNSTGTFVKRADGPNPTKRVIFWHNIGLKDEHCFEFYMVGVECTTLIVSANMFSFSRSMMMNVLPYWVTFAKQSVPTSS